MQGNTTTCDVSFQSRDCPDCEGSTRLAHIGGELPREICGRFGCEWDGRTLV